MGIMNYTSGDDFRPRETPEAPPEFVNVLTESLRQIACGQVVPSEPIVTSLRASAARIREERAVKLNFGSDISPK